MSESQTDPQAPEEKHVPYVMNGVRLDIVAQRISAFEWSLSIINAHGVTSTWTEFFECPDAAIDTAIAAIAEEGLEEFASIEGFEYLNNDKDDV